MRAYDGARRSRRTPRGTARAPPWRRRDFIRLGNLAVGGTWLAGSPALGDTPAIATDVCVYGGTAAGVTYTFGRESRDQYGESLAGVRPNMVVYDIDPLVTPGDPKSGLLPLLQDVTMGSLGSADKLTMGYGFRWKFAFTGDQLPLDPPDDYVPRMFELYRRAFAAKLDLLGRRMPKLGVYEVAGGRVHSSGAGNLARSLLAPTVYGCNAGYPDGDWGKRRRSGNSTRTSCGA